MTLDIRDDLSLWYLGEPSSPRLVGRVRLVMSGRGVSLAYDDAWLSTGFALSEDLPLVAGEHLPPSRDTAAGAVDDARPDRWGERVIRFLYRPPRLSILEYLRLAGPDRFGALGVSASLDAYAPDAATAVPTLADLDELHALVRKVEANEPIPENKARLLAPGATLGGARPKALLDMDGRAWVVKFADADEPHDMPLVEHAAMTLAAKAGIRTAVTRALPVGRGWAVAVRRFDREGTRAKPRRRHALSAHVALRAEGSEMGYPELAHLLRRRGRMTDGLAREQMREVFRRMVFNVLMDNTDDHEKNHALLVDDHGRYVLAPAFDVLPMGQGLGYQQMRVGAEGAVSSVENALSEARAFGLTASEAREEAARVAAVCKAWRGHFERAGVSDATIERLGRFVERPQLVDGRDALLPIAAGRGRSRTR